MEVGDQTSQMVDVLLHEKINFLAIDFDNTLVDIHLGDRYSGTLAELVSTFRPILVNLIVSAMRFDIAVSIVTFQKQTDLIKTALGAVFPSDIAERIVLRGNDETWHYEGHFEYGVSV